MKQKHQENETNTRIQNMIKLRTTELLNNYKADYAIKNEQNNNPEKPFCRTDPKRHHATSKKRSKYANPSNPTMKTKNQNCLSSYPVADLKKKKK